MRDELIEIVWAAGFFDGEGYSGLSTGYAQIHIGQIDREVLDRFREAVGFGKVYGPYERSDPNWSDKWEYKASGNDAMDAMNKILPYLGTVKREQWEKVMTEAIIPRRRGYCMNDLHEMTEENQKIVKSRGREEVRCLECYRESNRRSSKARYYRLKEQKNGNT